MRFKLMAVDLPRSSNACVFMCALCRSGSSSALPCLLNHVRFLRWIAEHFGDSFKFAATAQEPSSPLNNFCSAKRKSRQATSSEQRQRREQKGKPNCGLLSRTLCLGDGWTLRAVHSLAFAKDVARHWSRPHGAKIDRKDRFMEHAVAIYIAVVIAAFAVLFGWWVRHG